MIVAISGSLRHESVNSAALRAAERWATRSGMEFAIAEHLAQLPHFNPDREGDAPDAVRAFRSALEDADAVVMAVPEYAFGIPGAFKNALDWTVGSGSLDGKCVAVLSVAPPGRGSDVRHALGRVLTAVNVQVSYHSVPVAPSDRDEDGEIRNPAVICNLGKLVTTLSERSEAAERWTPSFADSQRPGS